MGCGGEQLCTGLVSCAGLSCCSFFPDYRVLMRSLHAGVVHQHSLCSGQDRLHGDHYWLRLLLVPHLPWWSLLELVGSCLGRPWCGERSVSCWAQGTVPSRCSTLERLCYFT